MSPREKALGRPVPPAIDWRREVKLVDEPNLPEQYHKFRQEDVLAIRAALAACRPLLVRGEPGAGKTQLAAAAAQELGRPLVKKVVDSRTEAHGLLWEFDAVQRLAEAQVVGTIHRPVEGRDAENEATHSAARGPLTASEIRSQLAVGNFVRPGPLWWGFDWEGARKQAERSGSPVPEYDKKLVDPAKGCVVLIDEIDKVEADVPNGLLEALGAGEFSIPQGRDDPVRVRIEGEFPLVVITTNEERVLPSAFVRRCLVHRLELPKEDDELKRFLVERAKVHFNHRAGPPIALFEKAADLLVADRKAALKDQLTPLPGQAEYLDLVRAVLTLEKEPKGQLTLLESVARFALRKQTRADG